MVSCAVQKLLKCKFEKLPKHLWGASGKEPACQSRRCWWFHPYDGKIPWRRKWQSTPVSLPGESRGQRSLVGYSPWGRTESNTTERLSTAQPVGVLSSPTRDRTHDSTAKQPVELLRCPWAARMIAGVLYGPLLLPCVGRYTQYFLRG